MTAIPHLLGGGKQQELVSYVYIPADTSEGIEERQIRVPHGKEVECLLEELKQHFRSGSAPNEAQQHAQKEALRKQMGGDASKVPVNLLAAAMDMQMVENIAIMSNRPDNGFVAVNMYCDDQAQVKALPLNPRASQLAACAGKMLEVRGDAFLARIFDNEDEFLRLDFKMSDMSSSAPWVAQANEQNKRARDQGDVAGEFMEKIHKQKKTAAAVFGGSTHGSGSSSSSRGGTSASSRPTPPSVQVREVGPGEADKDAGNAAFKAGKLEAAVAKYTQALQAEPTLLAAANNRALVYLRLAKHEEAEADCNLVLASDPKNQKAYFRRALAREGLNRRNEAKADLRHALVLDPTNKEAKQELQRIEAQVHASQAFSAANPHGALEQGQPKLHQPAELVQGQLPLPPFLPPPPDAIMQE